MEELGIQALRLAGARAATRVAAGEHWDKG
jgi:hypothetical protein